MIDWGQRPWQNNGSVQNFEPATEGSWVVWAFIVHSKPKANTTPGGWSLVAYADSEADANLIASSLTFAARAMPRSLDNAPTRA